MNQNLATLVGVHSQKNVSDQLFQQISSLILDGKLPEGYIFPNETVLCEQLHVGRTTLREAYKALELSGYVTRTKRGTTVNSQEAILDATPLKSIFTTASHKDFSEFRLMLESHSASLAALHAGLSDTRLLEENIVKTKEARKAEDYETMITLDSQFHHYIAEITDNSLVFAIVSVMNSAWDEGIRRNFSDAKEKNPKIFDMMLEQHTAIVEAIKNRNCELAREKMYEHIYGVTKEI